MNLIDKRINKLVLIWTTIIGGTISSLVKLGSNVDMPPIFYDEISPPAANIDAWLGWLGITSHSLDYVYEGIKISGATMLYHWLFSFVFTFLYVYISGIFPKIRLWYGAAYGLIIALVMHGILIPALGFRNPVYLNGKNGWLWNLNNQEILSELIGHLCWSMSIEVTLIAVLAILSKPLKGKWNI